MTPSAKVTREALALSMKARATLASRLIRSVDEPNQAELDTLWIAEAESRIDACEAGLIKTIPLADVKRKFEQRKLK